MIKYKNKSFHDLKRDGQIKLSTLFAKQLKAPFKKWIYNYKYRHLAPVNKTIKITVSDICGWHPSLIIRGASFQGQILPGDWDIDIIPKAERLNTSSKYIGLRERYLEGKKWAETELFLRYKKLLDQNKQVLGLSSVEELEMYYEENIDSLFNSIERNGILPASDEHPEIKPIYIHIGRDGELIYTADGNHRLAMTDILNLKEIPVQVWKRHQQWQEKREVILGEEHIPKELKVYLSHPDILSEYCATSVKT